MILCLTSGFPYRADPFLGLETSYHPEDTWYFSVTGIDGKKVLPVKAFKNPPTNLASRCKSGLCAITALEDPAVKEEIEILKREGRYNGERKRILIKAFAVSLRLSELLLAQMEDVLEDEPLILYAYWMYIPAIVGALIKRKYPKAKLISRAHSYDIYEYRANQSYLPFRKFIFDSADAIYPISQSGYDYLKSSYDYLNMNKVKVHHLGTLDKGLNAKKKEGEPFRIVSCSSISPIKRVDRILEALSLLDKETLAKRSPIEWVHFGSGEELEDLKAQANKKLANLPIKADFKGHVPNSEIYRYYQENHIDLFLNASIIEGIPVSIMEALSFGIPVIATDVGGTAEIVHSGKNGLLVKADFSNEDYAKAILMMMDLAPAEQAIYRKRARDFWEKEFQATKNYKNFVEENL